MFVRVLIFLRRPMFRIVIAMSIVMSQYSCLRVNLGQDLVSHTALRTCVPARSAP
jgi:hypothetical protein